MSVSVREVEQMVQNWSRQEQEELRDWLENVLEDQLEIATQIRNTSKKAQLEEDILSIRREIASATGWKGAHRTFPDEFTRARKCVGASYNRALKAIFKFHKALGVHLKDEIDTGKQFVYRADKPPNWKF